RPQYGFEGAYLVAGDTQDTITSRLYGLFESDLGNELGADMMTSTYNMFEATVFQLNAESQPAASSGEHAETADNKEPAAEPTRAGSTAGEQTATAEQSPAEAKPSTPVSGAAASKKSGDA